MKRLKSGFKIKDVKVVLVVSNFVPSERCSLKLMAPLKYFKDITTRCFKVLVEAFSLVITFFLPKFNLVCPCLKILV